MKSIFMILIVLNHLWRALCKVHLSSSIFSFVFQTASSSWTYPFFSFILQSQKQNWVTWQILFWKTSCCETSKQEHKRVPFLAPWLLRWRREMQWLVHHQLTGSSPRYFLSACTPLFPSPATSLPSQWSSSMLDWAVNTNYTKSPLLLPGLLVLLFCQMVEANV